MVETLGDASLRIQHALENAISAALETAKREAAEDPFLGHPAGRRGDEYYAFVALHRLFLVACGADIEAQTDGNVKTASKILHIGGNIARGWQREDVNARDVKLPANLNFSEDELKNREELRRSADRLVRNAITRALIEHVSMKDAEFRARVDLSIQARIPKDDSGSLQAEMFSTFVRAAANHLLDKS